MTLSKKIYLFIDECGDSEFYGKRKKLLVGQPGYQPLLIIGMIITENRRLLYDRVVEFQNQIKNDPLYNSIPSLNKPKGWYLHAKDDHPEVRAKFFEVLRKVEEYKAYMVIGRKKLEVFEKKHNNNPSEFYFDLLFHLLKNRLYRSDCKYQIYLAHRKKTTMPKFTQAIQKAIQHLGKKQGNQLSLNYQCDIIKSSEYPEMSVVDYLVWALQRYIIRKEERFFRALETKYSLIIDLYDFDNHIKEGNIIKNFYWKENQFGLDKASDFGI